MVCINSPSIFPSDTHEARLSKHEDHAYGSGSGGETRDYSTHVSKVTASSKIVPSKAKDTAIVATKKEAPPPAKLATVRTKQVTSTATAEKKRTSKPPPRFDPTKNPRDSQLEWDMSTPVVLSTSSASEVVGFKRRSSPYVTKAPSRFDQAEKLHASQLEGDACSKAFGSVKLENVMLPIEEETLKTFVAKHPQSGGDMHPSNAQQPAVAMKRATRTSKPPPRFDPAKNPRSSQLEWVVVDVPFLERTISAAEAGIVLGSGNSGKKRQRNGCRVTPRSPTLSTNETRKRVLQLKSGTKAKIWKEGDPWCVHPEIHLLLHSVSKADINEDASLTRIFEHKIWPVLKTLGWRYKHGHGLVSFTYRPPASLSGTKLLPVTALEWMRQWILHPSMSANVAGKQHETGRTECNKAKTCVAEDCKRNRVDAIKNQPTKKVPVRLPNSTTDFIEMAYTSPSQCMHVESADEDAQHQREPEGDSPVIASQCSVMDSKQDHNAVGATKLQSLMTSTSSAAQSVWKWFQR
jgi:hypothetical protein